MYPVLVSFLLFLNLCISSTKARDICAQAKDQDKASETDTCWACRCRYIYLSHFDAILATLTEIADGDDAALMRKDFHKSF